MGNIFERVRGALARKSLEVLRTRRYQKHLSEAKIAARTGLLYAMEGDLENAGAIRAVPLETQFGIRILGHQTAAEKAERDAQIYKEKPQKYLAIAQEHNLIVTRFTEQLNELRGQKR